MKFLHITLLLSLFGISIQAMDYKLVGPEDVKYLTEEALSSLIKEQKPDWVMPSADQFKKIHKKTRVQAYLDDAAFGGPDQQIKDALFEALCTDDAEAFVSIFKGAEKMKSNLLGNNFDNDDFVVEALKEEKYKCARALIEKGPNYFYDFKPTAYYYKVVGHKTMPDSLKKEFLDLIKSKSISK